jgi:hypothetical protein
MADGDGFREIFDRLIEEHGVTASTDRAICRAIARVMVDDAADAVEAGSTIAKLKALLPKPAERSPCIGEPDERLRRLADDELELLNCLKNRIEGRRFRPCGGMDPTVFIGWDGSRKRDPDAPDDDGLYRPDELAWLFYRDENARKHIAFVEGRVSELSREVERLQRERPLPDLPREPRPPPGPEPGGPASTANLVRLDGVPGTAGLVSATPAETPAERRERALREHGLVVNGPMRERYAGIIGDEDNPEARDRFTRFDNKLR